MECSLISPALSLLMKDLVVVSTKKLLISWLFISHQTVGWLVVLGLAAL